MAGNTKRTETVVGLFLFLGLIALGGMVIRYANVGLWKEESYPLTVEFRDGTGVIKGSTVRMLGARIGEVSEQPVLSQSSRILVKLAIQEPFKIPEGSAVQISSASLLGDKEIIITPPEPVSDSFIPSGAILKGGGAVGLDQLQNEATEIAATTRSLVKEAGGTLKQVDGTLSDLQALIARMDESLEIVNQGVLGEENVNNLSLALSNFNAAAKSLGELADEFKPAAGDARVAIFEIREAAREAKKAIAKIEPALADAPEVLEAFKDTAISLEKTAEEASAVIAKVEDGDGALSALTNDPKTKENTKVFLENLRKYGILGYRDEESKKTPVNGGKEDDDDHQRRNGRP